MHVNYCCTKRAKVADLRAILRAAGLLNRTAAGLMRWPAHSECVRSWTERRDQTPGTEVTLVALFLPLVPSKQCSIVTT